GARPVRCTRRRAAARDCAAGPWSIHGLPAASPPCCNPPAGAAHRAVAQRNPLSFDGLSKSFGSVRVLDGVSLRVPVGSVVGLDRSADPPLPPRSTFLPPRR